MTSMRALLGGVVALAAASVGPWSVGPAAATALPGAGSVVAGRYVTTVRLDDGALTVTRPPSEARPTVSEAAAAAEFTSDAQLSGYHRVAFGYGVVSVSAHGSGAGAGRISHLPAWIGFARTVAVYHCPAQTGSESPAGPAPPSNGYAAVVIGAADGAPAVTYVARSQRCSLPVPATLSPAAEEISIPWHAAGPLENGSIDAVASLPPCGSFSTVSSGGTAAAMTITLAALVPDHHRHCGARSTVTEKVVLNPAVGPGAPPPLAGTRTVIRHGRLGPETQVRPG